MSCKQLMSGYTGKVMPTLSLSGGHNSDPAYPFSLLNNAFVEHKPVVVDYSNQFSFLEGLLGTGTMAVGASSNSDLHTGHVSCDLLPSPERGSATAFSEMGSSITSSSNAGGFSVFGSELGAFGGGPFFSNRECQFNYVGSPNESSQNQFDLGVANNQNCAAMSSPSALTEKPEFADSTLQISGHPSQMVFGDSNFPGLSTKSPIFEQEEYQPSCEKFNKPLMYDAPCLLGEKMDPMHSQLPLDKSNTVYAASESRNLSSSAIVCAPEESTTRLQISVAHNILCAYSGHKSSAGNCLKSFVDVLHTTVCDTQICLCDRICPLLVHFDKCWRADCKICVPVREKCSASKVGPNSVIFYNGIMQDCGSACTGWSGSFSSENIVPPAKRLKSSAHVSKNLLSSAQNLKPEKSCSLLSSENSIASEFTSLKAQHSNPEGLPPLMQLPESPTSINSEVLEGKIEFLRNSTHTLTQKNAGDIYKLNAESVSHSKELSISPPPEHINHRNFSELDAVKDKPYEFGFSATPILSKEPDVASKEEVTLVRSNLDSAKPVVEDESEEKVKPDSPVIRGVSLIEFFSADEIEEHISSLQQDIGQRKSKEEIEKQIPLSANENTCQLCATDKLLLAPVPIYCSSCGSRIKRSVIYYSTSEENGMRHCFCTTCFKARGRSITFYGMTIPKAKLEKKKNVEEIEEPWVQCDKCRGWQHQICALYNDKRDMEGKSQYFCPKCCLKETRSREYMSLPPNDSNFFAKDLPRTLLSDFIERRLFRRLQQEREERANCIGKNVNEVPGAEDLVVRVVLSINKQLKVKEQFLGIFHDGDYPNGFPYRSKVILLFQKIEGADVCLFGLYVQEFGSDCSQPNHRCVYISYLDSVKYFRPERETATGEALRTFVYHEILIGYLEYCKKRGFVACYLWACPPIKGEDYILYCHPEVQKTPKPDKLRQWYHSMLKKAAKENIVVNVTNLYEHFFVSTGKYYSKVTAARLPYFDGDYWSSAAEITISNMEKKDGEKSGQKVKKVMTKRTLKSMGHTNFSDGATKDILLMQKLGKTILSVKEDFIVVHLQCVCSHCHEVIQSGWRWFCSQCTNFQLCERCHIAELGLDEGNTHTVNGKEKHALSKAIVDDIQSDTNDEDAILDYWLFENRHVFLAFCQKNYYQFDSLRRAKHSSMMILHHLHNPTMAALETTCNFCQQNTSSSDGNVCATCYGKKLGSSRIHKLAYKSSVSDFETKSPCDKDPNSQQEKMSKIMELLNVLEHASRCGATITNRCSYPNCRKLKRLFFHSSQCKIGVRGGCVPCHKVKYMLKLHATHCDKTDCCVPHCRNWMEGQQPVVCGNPSV